MTTDRRPALKALWKQAFGDPDWFIDAFFDTAYAPERCLYLEEEGSLAAALYWMDCDHRGEKLAYFYAVATGEAFRGRGLCRRLMALAHDTLKEQGYAGCILVPGSDALRQMYSKMGYADCSRVAEILCKPAAIPASLHRLDVQEYARLRREYLPENGVRQEGDQLNFLDMQTALYAGDGFLAAASVYEGKVHCMELLGDPNAAPGIVAALGGEEGFFRMPGTDKPFAMYRPLTDAPAPVYFGLAFD